MGRPCICCVKGSSSSSSSSSSSGSSSSDSGSSSSSSSSDGGGGQPECCADCFSVSLSQPTDNGEGGQEAGDPLWTSPVQNASCFFYFDPSLVNCSVTCPPDFDQIGGIKFECEHITDKSELPQENQEALDKFDECVLAGGKLEAWRVTNLVVGCVECPTNDGIDFRAGAAAQTYYFCCGETPTGCIDLYDSLGVGGSFFCTICWTINKEDKENHETSSSGFYCPCVQTECNTGDYLQAPLDEINYGSQPNTNVGRFRNMLGPGPGTELHKIIPKFLDSENCGCRDMAKKMNYWGPEKCDKNRESIVDYLVQKGKDIRLFGWVPKLAMREVADRMLSMAINRAKNKETENWFVAVTTAPREVPTVGTCLESLTVAGFRPYIFAEPNTNGIDMDIYNERMFQHEERQGVWRNWIYSAKYAIENSNAEIIMTVQDDSLFHPDSKTFAESILWPARNVGFVSLYTPRHYSMTSKNKTKERPPGVNRIYTKSLWGACALVWPRKVLEEVLRSDYIYSWLGAPTRTKSIWGKKQKERKENPALIQNSDTVIGKIMNQMKRSMFFVDPSPVNHFATHSATGHGGNLGRRNCYRCADFATPLQKQVPLMNNEQELFKIDYKDIEI